LDWQLLKKSLRREQAKPVLNADKITVPAGALPLLIAKASIANVVPQGIKIVITPRKAGANKSLLLDWFRTFRAKNFGG